MEITLNSHTVAIIILIIIINRIAIKHIAIIIASPLSRGESTKGNNVSQSEIFRVNTIKNKINTNKAVGSAMGC